jgi:hypothetical protein
MSAPADGQVKVSPKLLLALVVALAPTCAAVVPLDQRLTVAPTTSEVPAFTVPVIVGGLTPPLDEEDPPDDELLEEELLEVEPPPLEDDELLLDVEPPPLDDEEELLLEVDPPLEDEELLDDEEELPLGEGVPPPPPPPQPAIVSVVTTANDFSNVLIPYEDKFLTPLTPIAARLLLVANVTHRENRYWPAISISAGAHNNCRIKSNQRRE